MPRARQTLEDLKVAAAAHRPVDDRPSDYIAVDQVRVSPRNPRHTVEGLDELAASLQEYGLLQPVVVRRVNGAYKLIAGHRRLAAAEQLGWRRSAAVVRDETDDEAYLLTLTENLQRDDLTPKEEAAALEVLVSYTQNLWIADWVKNAAYPPGCPRPAAAEGPPGRGTPHVEHSRSRTA